MKTRSAHMPPKITAAFPGAAVSSPHTLIAELSLKAVATYLLAQMSEDEIVGVSEVVSQLSAVYEKAGPFPTAYAALLLTHQLVVDACTTHADVNLR